MSWLILPLILRRLPKHQRKEVTELLLPNVLATAPDQRLLLSAVTAERQARRAARREQELVKEAIAHAGFKNASDLTPGSAMALAFANLSATDKEEVFAAASRTKPSPKP
jgi:hypothetical protein